MDFIWVFFWESTFMLPSVIFCLLDFVRSNASLSSPLVGKLRPCVCHDCIGLAVMPLCMVVASCLPVTRQCFCAGFHMDLGGNRLVTGVAQTIQNRGRILAILPTSSTSVLLSDSIIEKPSLMSYTSSRLHIYNLPQTKCAVFVCSTLILALKF